MDAYRRPRGSPGKCFSQLRCRQDVVDPPADRFTGPYERRGPRRDRSRSPQAIDRYQPSDRNDRYRDREPLERRRRSSPPPVQAGIDRYVPGQDNGPIVIPTNPLQYPMSLECQAGFSYFAAWWREEQKIKELKERQRNGGMAVRGHQEAREEKATERERIQAAYDAYKEKFQSQQAKTFVQLHKNEEWFKERYNPEIRQSFTQKLADFRRAGFDRWAQDLDNSTFDEFTLEGIYKSESNGAGGIVEKEEGEAPAANEMLTVGDLVPSRGGDLRDDAALQPTLLIKTIAPTVCRDKVEELCRESLGEQEGGFKWLSLSDPNPQKRCHRMGWIILNPFPEGSDEITMGERGDGRDEDGEEGEDGEARTARSEAGDPVPVGTAEKAVSLINGKEIVDPERGNFTCHVGIHVPPSAPRKKALWDLFSAPERIERDLHLAERLVDKMDEQLGPEYTGRAKVEERVEYLRSKGFLQPPVNAPTATKKERDLDAMSDEEGALDDDEEGAIDEDVDDEDLLAKKKTLDLLVEYLRRVHNFCFFCVFESDSVHELTRKCPGGHLRRPRASLTSGAKTAAKASAEGKAFPFKKQESTNDGDPAASPTEERKPFRGNTKTQKQLQQAFNWVRTYEDKLLMLLEPESTDLKRLGGKSIEEGLEEELTRFVKQEDESKFRCKVPECSKLFKALNFWRKHVEKRHTEFYEGLTKEVRFGLSIPLFGTNTL